MKNGFRIVRRFLSVYNRRKQCDTLRKKINVLSVIDLNIIRQKSLRYAEALRIQEEPYGRYRYSDSGKVPILYASVYAVLVRHLLNDFTDLKLEDKMQWTEYICSHQNEDGLFRDPFVENDIAETEDWWGWRHLTIHALMALKALDSQPKRQLYFLEKFNTPPKVRLWLNTLDWGRRVAFTSNTIQNIGVAMQFARDFMGEENLKDAIAELLFGIKERCNPKNGLWGYGFDTKNEQLSQGIQAGYHFWLLFWYDDQKITFPEKVFNSALKLQNKLGGFSREKIWTSACEDIDALDPIVRLGLRNDNFKERSFAPIQRALKWILFNFNEDGGATFQRSDDFFYGHSLMFSKAGQSTMFATWFRMLSIAMACELLKFKEGFVESPSWRFLDSPGLQFTPEQSGRHHE